MRPYISPIFSCGLTEATSGLVLTIGLSLKGNFQNHENLDASTSFHGQEIPVETGTTLLRNTDI